MGGTQGRSNFAQGEGEERAGEGQGIDWNLVEKGRGRQRICGRKNWNVKKVCSVWESHPRIGTPDISKGNFNYSPTEWKFLARGEGEGR